jgi:hypothetical protein
MSPLFAIAGDTLRALCARRLFWLHLWLSIAVALVFASITGTASGWSLGFGLQSENSPWLRDGTPWEQTLQCWVLSRAVRWWIAGASVILTLFATAAILPESLETGQAALLLPRVRRRAVLLGGRFLGSLYYFLLLTSISIALLMLVARWRLGAWHWDLWYSLPAALLLYTPLHAVASLMGVLTRSTTAALLVALLFGAAASTLQEAASSRKPLSASAQQAAASSTDDAIDDDDGSWTTHFARTALHGAAALLPAPAPVLSWAERHGCPVPARPYRDLFSRLRAGKSGLEAAAANVLATNSAGVRKAASVPGLPESTAGAFTLTAACLALAASLLHRRDL